MNPVFNIANAAVAVVIIGALMPYAVSLLKQVGWPKWANMGVTILLCAIAGTVNVWANNGFNNFRWENLAIVIGAIFLASQAAYAAYWKGTPTEDAFNQRFSHFK